MEYVRICEAYGVGFYYTSRVPETCLKVAGYVRMDVGAGAFGLTDFVDKSGSFPAFRFAPRPSTTPTTCWRASG